MHKGRLGVAVLLLFAAVFCFSGCNIKSDEKTVFVRDTDPAYVDLLRDIAPDCTVRDGEGLSSLLSSVDGEDKAFALFDVQARASKDAGTGGIWYEHFATAADRLETLCRLMQEIGVTLIIDGNLPAKESLAWLGMDIITEAVTNSVRHGLASEVYISLGQSGGNFSMRITDNGIPPKSEPVEGGGLSSIRRKVGLLTAA